MKFRNSIGAVSVLGLACATCWGSEAAETTAAEAVAEVPFEIRSENDKVLYSLGYELGKDLKRQELELSRDALLKGVDDALEGSKPLVSRTGRSAALAEIREKRAQENLEKSQAFLAENALKNGVVTLESGLQYRVVQAGEGKTPQTTDKVLVNYRGTFIDGGEFDSSYGRGKPSSLRVSKVIKGWREALLRMKEGDRWELYIPPDLAYGKRGRGKQIPPNSALIFEVELLEVE
jgi:FKBP-type peptidyl-prolyl cis-trans isomerase FklB